MNFKTFIEVAKYLPKDVSVLLRGAHGIGKTEIIRQISKDYFNLPLMERRPSQLSEGDLLGLPDLKDGTTKFAPPDWFVECQINPYTLFLDEIDRASNEVLQAIMELLLERSIQGKKVHKDTRIYAAINGGKHGANYKVSNLDPAIMDRFWIVDIEPTENEWIEWAENGNVIDEIVLCIKKYKNENILEYKGQIKDPTLVTPSRRSWKRLSDTIKPHKEEILSNDNLLRAISKGFIGSSATNIFANFVLNMDKIVSAEDVVNNYDLFKEKIESLGISNQAMIIDQLQKMMIKNKKKRFKKQQLNNIYSFFKTLTPEIQMTFFDKVTNKDIDLEVQTSIVNLIDDDIIKINQ